jgi:hypothetical protein
MAGRIRKSVAVFTALVVMLGAALPAGASSDATETGKDPVSPTVDLLLLRPLALVSLVGGTVLFVVSSPILLITRPQDIGKPFNQLVGRPAKYVWADPIGVH